MDIHRGKSMKMRTLAAMALGATTLLSASSALAVEPAQLHEGASVAALIGFGENAFLFDTGVRGGYTLPNHVYLGGTFLLNVGSGSYGGYYGNAYAYYGGSSVGFTTGFEGGYEFAAGPVVVRPYGGFGFANETYSYGGYPNACGPGNPNVCYGNYSPTSSSVVIWGGGTAIYDFKGGPWFVTGDVRLGDAPFLLYNQVLASLMAGGGYEF